jgi:hypothetical protein
MWVNWIRFDHFGPRRVPNFTGSVCAPSSTHRTRPRFPSLFFSFKGCGRCRRKNNKTQLSRFTPAAVFKVRQRHNITSRKIKEKIKKSGRAATTAATTLNAYEMNRVMMANCTA